MHLIPRTFNVSNALIVRLAKYNLREGDLQTDVFNHVFADQKIDGRLCARIKMPAS